MSTLERKAERRDKITLEVIDATKTLQTALPRFARLASRPRRGGVAGLLT